MSLPWSVSSCGIHPPAPFSSRFLIRVITYSVWAARGRLGTIPACTTWYTGYSVMALSLYLLACCFNGQAPYIHLLPVTGICLAVYEFIRNFAIHGFVLQRYFQIKLDWIRLIALWQIGCLIDRLIFIKICGLGITPTLIMGRNHLLQNIHLVTYWFLMYYLTTYFSVRSLFYKVQIIYKVRNLVL